MLVLFSALVTGAVAGVMALPHCVAMCGPYAAFACTAGGEGPRAARADVRYLGARSVAYAALGGGAGATGGLVRGWLPPTWASVLLACTLALGMVSLALRLVRAERAEQRAGQLVQLRERPPTTPRPLAALRDLPARAVRFASTSPTLLGVLNALFPCGALYAALMVAAATASPWAGTASMLGFSMTSAFALGVSGWVARASMSLDRQTRLALGAALVVGAVVLVVRPFLQTSPDQGPACHSPSSAEGR
jgi:sulfite exporter TauE/SafE